MKNASFKIAAAAFAVASAFASQAYAAGFQLTEQSSLGLGRAYAGAGIVGDDLSAVHYNPAGMTLLPGANFQAGVVYIDTNLEFEGNDGCSENGRYGKGQGIPAGYFTRQISEDVWFGMGLTVPFGMGTGYNKNWEHADRGTDSTILTFDINPNLAWKINDFVSIGAGVSFQYAEAKLGMRTGAEIDNPITGQEKLPVTTHGKIKADSWDFGYNFGIMISPTDKLRFGLAYRSAIEHDAEGTLTVSDIRFADNTQLPFPTVELGATATVKTPDTVMLTATWEATQDLRLSGLIRWANWSNFETLSINSPSLATIGASTSIDVHNNWEDTWLFSLGADYRLNNEWTVRAGIAYETDAIDDQSTRMAVIPDTDRLWLAFGASYKYNDSLQFDVGAAWLTGVGNTDLYDEVGGKKVGEYSTLDAYLLGAQLVYRF